MAVCLAEETGLFFTIQCSLLQDGHVRLYASSLRPQGLASSGNTVTSPYPQAAEETEIIPELCFHSICPLSFFVAVAFVGGETSDTLGEESASQPVETKIVKEKKRDNQRAHCAQNSQASGECDEGQVLNAKTGPGLHERGRSCAQPR